MQNCFFFYENVILNPRTLLPFRPLQNLDRSPDVVVVKAVCKKMDANVLSMP